MPAPVSASHLQLLSRYATAVRAIVDVTLTRNTVPTDTFAQLIVPVHFSRLEASAIEPVIEG